ncbi:thioredoxin domain-containing protein [Pedobacter sp.]|uniref:thioredoxin domain-containing protein n=1 Tax=Pedobacter sp. TaxID=1411316 RepID=UPI00396CCB23
MSKQANNLIHASSPYLLQHAYNPVEWYEWGPEALQKAKDENKLIIVSIGYSACHWCHVMERESFENYEVAEVMNKHFICIKVDREERPDIDQVYMLAVQLMNGNGGWPLNAICLPDQKPVYGGTYFRKSDWINILLNLAKMWEEQPAKATAYAERLIEGVHQAEKIIPVKEDIIFELTQIEKIVAPWQRSFDITDGGYNRAPKFPLPNNWAFLLRYGFLAENQSIFNAAMNTLEKMMMGGIYDHLAGGFARYSVDDKWHVPHFEKMLYDNAQLLSLYTEAYQCLKHKPFRQIAIETIDWLFNEMMDESGLFYSALDADSEGIEGKFYVWDKKEFDEVVGEDTELLSAYFNVTEQGNWEEEETNILRRVRADEALMEQFGIDEETLNDKVGLAKAKLQGVRNKRVRPGLDDKCLTAWNAMTIKALTDAAYVFNYPVYYGWAKCAMEFILENLATSKGGLYRNYKQGKVSINGFLDDYAFTIDALIALYEYDFNEKWLQKALNLTDYVTEHFADDETEMFFYTDKMEEALIARKHEVMDNVIPASNSVMAQNLQKLALYFDQNEYAEKAAAMLKSVLPRIKNYGSGYSNWCIQLLNEIYGINEIAIAGKDIEGVRAEFSKVYIPNKIRMGGTNSTLPLLKDKQSDETKIYICRNKTCQLPVETVEEAVNYIN